MEPLLQHMRKVISQFTAGWLVIRTVLLFALLIDTDKI